MLVAACLMRSACSSLLDSALFYACCYWPRMNDRKYIVESTNKHPTQCRIWITTSVAHKPVEVPFRGKSRRTDDVTTELLAVRSCPLDERFEVLPLFLFQILAVRIGLARVHKRLGCLA